MINKVKTTFAKKLRSNQTDVEKILWYQLRAKRLLGIKFKRQQPIGKYIVDFISFERKLIIELDGGQHNEETNKIKDDKRKSFLQNEGFTVLRFWNNEVLENLEGVLEAIKNSLSPTLPPDGGGSTKKLSSSEVLSPPGGES